MRNNVRTGVRAVDNGKIHSAAAVGEQESLNGATSMPCVAEIIEKTCTKQVRGINASRR
jgi:hypothetical protein